MVNGGEHYKESVLVDNEVKKQIELNSELAPLHNPQTSREFYQWKN